MSGTDPSIDSGTSNWSGVCALLAAFDGAGIEDPTITENDEFRAWAEIEERTRVGLKRLPSREVVGREEAAILHDAIAEGPVGCHAAAWALDLTRHHTFSRPWAVDREIALADGDLFPVCDWDTERRPLRRRMPRPWQTQRLNGELPHVRRFRASPERPSIVFDGRYFDELAFLSGLETISLLTPNASLDEFEVPDDGFPIRVRDDDAQTASIEAFIHSEVCDGAADLALVPELAGTERAVATAAALMGEGHRNALVLAGTRHETAGERRTNIASVVLPSGEVLRVAKRTPFWDVDVREGITECGEPIRVLVSADVRLAVLICKDFLVPSLLEAVAHAGANLILVPSMSRRLDLHDVAARELAARAHALCVVANGPPDMDGEAPATALIGRPEADSALTVATYRTEVPGRAVRFMLPAGAYEES